MKKDNLTILEIRLIYIREINNLTQKELADKLNVNKSLISIWEGGYRSISLRKLVKLSSYYQIPIDYFLGLTTKFNINDYDFISDLNLEYLGKQLKTIRIKQGLKQVDFATKFKTSYSNISYYESGTKTISVDDLKDICNSFGYSADWLVGNTKKFIKRKKNITIKGEEIRNLICE